ncbi:MAG: LytR/AlgR family response regulator transcription factor [Thermovenabulum sp.]|uniref:LytR/AlgR family response regulator transcription factor n=1 Tax=Thermovenabulum sp. TaxID=3100335 RepID=UPI003C79F0F3
MKALIVEDEEYSAIELKYLLKKIDKNIKVIGIANSGQKALNILKKFRPDVIFLDIKLNDLNGLDIAKSIASWDEGIKIIFTTAYDEYAVKAFELNAVDYILKPFSEERLKKAIEKMKKHFGVNNIETGKKFEDVKKLPVKSDSKLIFIDIDEIIFIEADGRNSLIKTANGVYRSLYSLKDIEDRLKNSCFFRVHKSYIINLKKIKEIIPWFNNTYIIKLSGSENIEIPVSKNKANELKAILNI